MHNKKDDYIKILKYSPLLAFIGFVGYIIIIIIKLS